VIAGLTWLTGLGYGWVSVMQTPGKVRNWLSASTLLGEAGGQLTKAVGLGDLTDRSISVFRGAGGLIAVTIFLLLLARAGRYQRGPAAVGALGMALIAIVALSPVVQPWYLLWGFVLIAGGVSTAGTRRAVVIASAFLAMALMPKGGTVDVSAIVQAVLAGLAVAGSAALFELLPGRPTAESVAVASGTMEA
jgi:alpha-1,6-mannosyltransferase